MQCVKTFVTAWVKRLRAVCWIHGKQWITGYWNRGHVLQ